jgi:hypothetical protein
VLRELLLKHGHYLSNRVHQQPTNGFMEAFRRFFRGKLYFGKEQHFVCIMGEKVPFSPLTFTRTGRNWGVREVFSILGAQVKRVSGSRCLADCLAK